MFAIVDIKGQQFKVEEKQNLFVHRLEEKEGELVDFSSVLLIDKNGDVKIGKPILKNAVVKAKVLSHLKGDKVKVFKKKRRKGYKKLVGHRQYLTELEIQSITETKPITKTEKES